MASGIRDKVAIVGMGCSKFGERWECGPEDLMVDAFIEASADAGIERDQIEAAWLGATSDEIRASAKCGNFLGIALQPAERASDARREPLCIGHRGVAWGVLRRGQRRL